MAAYVRYLLVYVCCTVRQWTLPDDGATVTPKHVGAVLM